MSGVAAAALILVSSSAAVSLLLLLPALVAAESLANRPLKTARRFWLTLNLLPMSAGVLLTTCSFLFLLGDITATPHQDRVRPHVCVQRFTEMPDAAFRVRLAALAAAGLLGYAVIRFLASAHASQRAETLAWRLVEVDPDAEDEAGPPVVVLESEEASCFSLGLSRPVVILTSGLPWALTESETEAVLAHEQCHIRHKDTRLELLVRLLTDALVWVPSTHYFLRNLRAVNEQLCDWEAAEQTSVEALTSALEKMARLHRARQSKLQGDLAGLKPAFPDYARPEDRIAALTGGRYLSFALPLGAILAVEASVLAGLVVWLARPLHDTLYCAAKSLIEVLRF